MLATNDTLLVFEFRLNNVTQYAKWFIFFCFRAVNCQGSILELGHYWVLNWEFNPKLLTNHKLWTFIVSKKTVFKKDWDT